MHAPIDHHRLKQDAHLAAALRNLPSHTPPVALLPRLVARVQRRRRNQRLLRYGVPAALAAGIALAVMWPRPVTINDAVPAPVVAEIAPVDAQLLALRQHSQDTQSWVRELGQAGAPPSTAALIEIAELEDRIALIDLQLSARNDANTQASLWRQRIALLQQLGMLHIAPSMLAAAPAVSSQAAVRIN